MTQRALQRDVRSAISITYELLRHERILARERIARALGDLESELARIEAKLGGPRRGEIVASSLDCWMARVEEVAAEADPVVADQIRALVASLRNIQRNLAAAALSPDCRRASLARAPVLAAGAVGLGALALVARARAARARAAFGFLGAFALGLTAAAAALAVRRRRARV